MKRKHTYEYVAKIADEMGYTLGDVRYQVRKYSGQNMRTYETLNYLCQFDAETIRRILRFNRL